MVKTIKCFSMFYLLSATFYLLPSTCLYSYTYRGAFLQLGDTVVGLTASGASGVYITDEPSTIFKNPAAISVCDGKAVISNSLLSIYERRALNDEDGTTLSNNNMFLRFSNVGVSHPAIKGKLSVAICMSELYDFNYFYEKYSFASNIAAPQIIGKKLVKSKGFVYGIGCGFSHTPVDRVILGFSAYNIFGSPEREINEIDYGQILSEKGLVTTDVSTITAHSFNGMFFVLGGAYNLTKKIKVNIAYRPGREIEDELTTVYKDDIVGSSSETKVTNRYKFPASISAGVTFEFPGAPQSILSLNFVHTRWSKARIKSGNSDWTDCEWTDTLSWQAGVRHRVKENFVFSYGVGFLPDYSKKGSQSVVVSGGISFKVWVTELGVSAQYFMRRNTLEDRLFPVEDDPEYPRLNKVTIDDYTKRFLLTTKIKW
ncbi:MAG: hypothetical protein JW983_02245 [Elusimicrobia bacterium]|nr:hypothetical protein [Elusimicrobiota bacterium]